MVVHTGEFCHYGYSSLSGAAMTTMNISLPETLDH
jgi:hypothetical protein